MDGWVVVIADMTYQELAVLSSVQNRYRAFWSLLRVNLFILIMFVSLCVSGSVLWCMAGKFTREHLLPQTRNTQSRGGGLLGPLVSLNQTLIQFLSNLSLFLHNFSFQDESFGNHSHWWFSMDVLDFMDSPDEIYKEIETWIDYDSADALMMKSIVNL